MLKNIPNVQVSRFESRDETSDTSGDNSSNVVRLRSLLKTKKILLKI